LSTTSSNSKSHDFYENAHGLATSLTADEGDALAVLDALLGFGRADAVRGAVDIGAPRPEFSRLAARHIAVAVARWLTEGGGHRERSVLRADRRESGRVWDESLIGDWAPTFSKSSVDFWLGAARNLPALDAERAAIASDGPGARKKRRVLKEILPVSDGGRDGDWVFFYMAHRAVPGFALAPEDERQVLRALRKASPLAGLFALDLQEDRDTIAAERVSWLFAPGTVRVLECAQDRLARAWEQSLLSLWSRNDTVSNLLPLWKAANRALGAYVAAADSARRCDLLRPLLRMLAAIPAKVIVGGGDAARARVVALSGWTSIKERDEMLASVRAVTDLGARMNRLREQFVLERYGDDRYEEAQLFLRAFAEEFAEKRARLDDLSRGLSNTVG
jgi:hypothetical protein